MESILVGILSFFNSDEHTLGAISTSSKEKERMAVLSKIYNMRNTQFIQIFENHLQTLGIEEKLLNIEELELEEKNLK